MKKPLFISTYCCIDHSLDTALETLATRTSHVEILSDGLHDLRRESGTCNDHSLSYSVHAPSSEMNIAAVSERIRTASLEDLGDVMAICNRIGAKHLVVHPGYSPYVQMWNRSYSSLLHSLDDLVRLQDEYGVLACVENMGAWECCHFRTPSFLPELTFRGLHCTLDCGHARLNGNLDEFLAAGDFCHIHLHNNDGENDDHGACSEGTIDYHRLWNKLPRGATLVVETRELASADQSLRYLSTLNQGEH
ncbi:MAG TPA: sugar phosphate isomerase/epimerase family protein [Methanolinea sp.]|jgi:sugar phosphate isomerase/epimerase|nr:sugar phosphate isomerase/epimerase family protein [Methanolinea sp.]